MKLSGELGEGILPGVLRTLYAERRTGMLHVTRGGDRASICFIEGNIVYGSTTVKEARFGQTLVRHGLLTEWDQARAAEMVDATGRRFGQILLDLGIFDADRLEEALAVHVRELLLIALSWPDGRFEFEDQDRAVFRGYDRPLRLSTGEVILDAVWSIADPDVIRFGLGDLDRVLAQTTDPLLRFQRLNLNEKDGFLLSRVDGVLTARQILDLAPLAAEEAQRSLLGLIYTGMVEYVRAPPKSAQASGPALAAQVLEAWAALPHQSHYQVLGVAENARSAEILAAYFRLARLYHPDTHHQPGLEQLKAKLETLFARVTEAHRVISNPALRVAYDQASAARDAPTEVRVAPAVAAPVPTSDPETITQLLNQAEQALEGGQPAKALALSGEALQSATGSTRRRGILLNARASLKGGGTRKAAEDELKRNLEEDPGHAEAHVLLGTIYRDGGAAALAAACFRRALALRPRLPEALAELAALHPTESHEGGMLKRLFQARRTGEAE